MRLQMSKGIKGRLPAYEREYPLPKPPSVPPSPDALSEASDSAVLERGF